MSELTKNEFWNGDLPDLSKAKEAGFEVGSTYWNPVSGEVKRVFFAGFEDQTVPAFSGDGEVDLRVALFVEVIDGRKCMISNGAKRLVSTLENHNIDRGTPLQITYIGKRQNKKNSNMSDCFQMVPLSV